MNEKFLRRYLILIAVLVLCAGVVWFMANSSKTPADDAVLARAGILQNQEASYGA